MRSVPIGSVRSTIRELVAYPIEHERVPVKLDANELGFDLPSGLAAAVQSALSRIDLRRYPEGHADSLTETVAREWHVAAESVLVGNGSNEMIALTFAAFGGDGADGRAPAVVLPTPSFGVYPIQARTHGFEVVSCPLDERFELDPERVLDATRRHRARLVVLASPNNPTGNAFQRVSIERILDGFDGPVVVDEAYQPFATESWLGRWDRWPNLLVLRTLSKVGLAALRVGFLFADPRLTAELRKAKLPFNLNSMSAAVARVALDAWSDLEAVAQGVIAERRRLQEALSRLGTLEVFPSEANFLLVRVPGDANQLWSRLLERGISVRNFSAKAGLAGCLRITVGRPHENDQLIASLGELLAP
ncbi:MAG: histidinol-phosphate transaminase [Deltaproteobacteria bacterium]|nr:histidinol-phosphate transaminase [Deltaproteobacteria bacterium]